MKDPKIPHLANLRAQFQQALDAATTTKPFDQELAQATPGQASQAPVGKE